MCTLSTSTIQSTNLSFTETTTTRTTHISWASVRCSSKVSSLVDFIEKFKKISSLDGILCSKTWRKRAKRNSRRAERLHANTMTPEAAEDFEKAWNGFISMSLEIILKDFELTRSFKNVVNLDNSMRLARASATTTTTSTTTTCCESAASELLQALLSLLEA